MRGRLAAFYGGEVHEARVAQRRLLSLVSKLRESIVWERHLSLFTNSYHYITIILPGLIIAPRYFAGEVRATAAKCAWNARDSAEGPSLLVLPLFLTPTPTSCTPWNGRSWGVRSVSQSPFSRCPSTLLLR